MRLLACYLLLMTCPALLAQTTGPAQSDRQAIEGRWVVRATPVDASRQADAIEADHVLTFRTRQVWVEGPLGQDFGPTSYETAGPDFRMIFRHEKLGTVLWAGETNDDSIRGIIRWTRKDGAILTYRFEGQRGKEQG